MCVFSHSGRPHTRFLSKNIGLGHSARIMLVCFYPTDLYSSAFTGRQRLSVCQYFELLGIGGILECLGGKIYFQNNFTINILAIFQNNH